MRSADVRPSFCKLLVKALFLHKKKKDISFQQKKKRGLNLIPTAATLMFRSSSLMLLLAFSCDNSYAKLTTTSAITQIEALIERACQTSTLLPRTKRIAFFPSETASTPRSPAAPFSRRKVLATDEKGLAKGSESLVCCVQWTKTE